MVSKINQLIKNKPYLIGVVILVVHIVISYYGQWRHQYLVPPGDDVFVHLNIINDINRDPTIWPSAYYPPGFHYLVILFSKITGLSFLTSMVWMWPSLLILSGLVIWQLANVLFGKKVGLLAYLLYALVSLQPLQTANDGSFPNILASGILIPIALLCWVRLWTSQPQKRWPWILLVATLTGLIVYTHHFSTMVWGSLLLSSTFFLGIAWVIYYRRGWSSVIKFLVLFIGGLVVSSLLFLYLPVFSPERHLLQAVNSIAVFHKQYPLHSFVTAINPVIALFGFMGSVWLLGSLNKKSQWNHLASVLIVLLWFGIYFFGSRFSIVGEPERLGRDWAMPGVVVTSYCIVRITEIIKSQGVKYLFITLISLSLIIGFFVKLNQLSRYNPMIRFSNADSAMLTKIDSLTSVTWPIYIVTNHLTEKAWRGVVTEEISSGKIVFVDPDIALEQQLPDSNHCLATSYNSSRVWPNEFQDNSTLLKLIKVQDSMLVYKVDDLNKTWYLLCK